MKRSVVTSHIYEISLRVVSQEPLDTKSLAENIDKNVDDILKKTNAFYGSYSTSQTVVRELCFAEDGGDVCLMTEGHRGRHEGASGRRWGNDQ